MEKLFSGFFIHKKDQMRKKSDNFFSCGHVNSGLVNCHGNGSLNNKPEMHRSIASENNKSSGRINFMSYPSN